MRTPSLAGGRTRVGRSQPQASPDWRPPRGLQGLAGLRADAPSEARSADGERAGRPRDGRKSGEASSTDGSRAGRPRDGRKSGEASSADGSRTAGPSGARNTSGASGPAGPGRGAGGRRQGQGGPRDRPLRAAGSRVAISRAGRRPPAHTAARPIKATRAAAGDLSGQQTTTVGITRPRGGRPRA